MFGGHERITLSTGATLSCGQREVSISLEHPDGRSEHVTLDYPSAGLGGLELVVSPDQSYAALFVYSGQSQQGWELFSLAPTLRHLGGLPYILGEGMAPVFSPDSRWLAMAVTSGWRERGTDRHAEEVLDTDAEGQIVIEWARLYLQRLPDGPVESIAIGTAIPASMDPDDLFAWNLHEVPVWLAVPDADEAHSARRLSIPLPWGGSFDVAIPDDGRVVGPLTTSAFEDPEN